jgi:hypothetical protein
MTFKPQHYREHIYVRGENPGVAVTDVWVWWFGEG